LRQEPDEWLMLCTYQWLPTAGLGIPCTTPNPGSGMGGVTAGGVTTASDTAGGVPPGASQQEALLLPTMPALVGVSLPPLPPPVLIKAPYQTLLNMASTASLQPHLPVCMCH
jgi:hypothetical protein